MTFVLHRRAFTTWLIATGGSAFIGCSSSDDGGESAGTKKPRVAAVLAPLAGVKLSTERTLVPVKTRLDLPGERNPLIPADRFSLMADGFGDYTWGPGEAVIERMPDGSSPPAAGTNAKRLARFIHVSDIHVTDDESPARMALFDGGPPFDGAARPHAAHMGRVLNAAVRTVNALNTSDPIDFVLLGGDSTDSALKNELTWMVQILSGADVVTCDSGDANDPESGSNNDPKDPFVAEGLAVPWMFCMGNHDAEIMGLNAIGPATIATATGDNAVSGCRDWSQPDGPVRKGTVVADPERQPLTRAEMLALVAADGTGHGLKDLATDKASYVFDVGADLRFIVYDTALEAGGAEGIMRNPDVDAFLRPALDQAKSDGKLVVLVSHHGLDKLGDGSAGGSSVEAETMPAADVQELFLSYDNVLMSLTGHTHEHVVRWVPRATTGGFWEIQTCSLVEFPQQMRLIEVTDEDNGYLSFRLVGVDFATDGDDVAEMGRALSILDHTSGWGAGYAGLVEDRNVKLYVPKPV